MKSTADVVIVGGGCMGASTAFHLARRGLTNVVLVERESMLGLGSTGRNAGGVRHQFSHEANVRLSIESIRVLERFEEEVGVAIDFHQDGYLFLLSTPESLAAFRRNADMQRALGVPTEVLGPDEAGRLAPGLRVDGIVGATYCARDGIADPNGVTLGFAKAAQAAGVQVVVDTEVTGLLVEHGRVAAVRTSRGAIATPVVVNAAGPYASAIGRMVDIDIPVRPYRRHIFIARPPAGAAVPATRILVIDFETTFYFHRESGSILFGMGDPAEPPTYDTSVRWDFLERVVPVAVRRLPALADAEVTRAWAGLYEVTPDAMPIIGPVDEVPGLYLLNGFSGHGFQHSPAAGRLLADLITGRTVNPSEVAAFAWNRFARAARPAEANVV